VSMIKCAPEVKAKCPFKHPCCGDESGYYLAGSECDKFAETVLAAPPTNGNHIRSMTDEELAMWLVDATVCERVCDEDEYCHGNECVKRVTDWLQQPVKEEYYE
jgi:hypothetical protein